MTQVKDRVASLQKIMRERQLDAYIVPSSDPHQSEYVAEPLKRREYISGFTGSAGFFACTQREAGVWTDGRYWVQGEAELQGSGIKLFKQGQAGVPDWKEWLIGSLSPGAKIGYNAELFSIDRYQALASKLAGSSCELVDVSPIWSTKFGALSDLAQLQQFCAAIP